jgi:hypothetical protein
VAPYVASTASLTLSQALALSQSECAALRAELSETRAAMSRLERESKAVLLEMERKALIVERDTRSLLVERTEESQQLISRLQRENQLLSAELGEERANKERRRLEAQREREAVQHECENEKELLMNKLLTRGREVKTLQETLAQVETDNARLSVVVRELQEQVEAEQRRRRIVEEENALLAKKLDEVRAVDHSRSSRTGPRGGQKEDALDDAAVLRQVVNAMSKQVHSGGGGQSVACFLRSYRPPPQRAD